MEFFKNDFNKLKMVATALGLCQEAMRALAFAVRDVREMLSPAVIPPAKLEHVSQQVQAFVVDSNDRLNAFMMAAAMHLDRLPPHLLNHIIEAYEFGGPMCVPNLTWVTRLTQDFRERWAMDLLKQAKPPLEIN
jgi:hypothetical protein